MAGLVLGAVASRWSAPPANIALAELDLAQTHAIANRPLGPEPGCPRPAADAAEAPGPHAPRADLWSFAKYHDVSPTPLGDQVMMNGVPLNLAVLHAGDPVGQVARYYAAKLTDAGFNPAGGPLNSDGSQWYISYHPEDAGMNVLTLVADRDGTQIYAGSSAHMRELLEQNSPTIPPDVPAPGSPEDVMMSEFLEGGQRHRNITYSLREIGVEQVLAYYQTALGARGLHPVAEPVNSKGRQLVTYEGAHQEVTLSVAPQGPSILSVSLVWVES